MKISIAAAALVIAPLLAAPALGGEVEGLSKRIGEGKNTFKTVCATCHKIEIPLAKTMNRDGWNDRIDDMVSKGLKISSGDRSLVVDYLTARSLFQEKCTVCHTTERIENTGRTRLVWEGVLDRMAAKDPSNLSAGDREQLKAYIFTVLEAPSAY